MPPIAPSPVLRRLARLILAVGCASTAGCAAPPAYDVVIRGGAVSDGSGEAPVIADVAITGDSIVASGVVAGG